MKTLIYVCYVALFTTPVKQECHLEKISHPPAAVAQWCSELEALPDALISQCHEYRPGEESTTWVWNGGAK
jgi:hypothetical protein